VHEAFNPYLEWLGVRDGRRPGNHYELLGIDLYESDPAVIAQAADVLTARIRSVRPGPHVAEWQRLLDALKGAKTCLLDRTAKAAYDTALRSELGGTPQPGGQAAPPAGTPVQHGGQPPTRHVPPWQAPPGPYASMGGRPHTPAASNAATGVPPPNPARPISLRTEPIPPTAAPIPIGSASPTEAAPPFAHNGVSGGPAMSRAGPRRGPTTRPSVAQITAGVLTLVLVAVAAILAFVVHQQRRAGPGHEPAISHANAESSPVAPDGPAKRPPRPTPPQQDGASISFDAKKPTPKKGPQPEQQPKRDGERVPEEKPEPAEASRPEDEPTPSGTLPPADETRPEEAPTTQSPADRQRQPALKQALADARFSMSEHDLPVARRHLEAAAANAETPAELAEIDRLDTLLGHLEAFWTGMSRVVAGLEAAEALPVGQTFVAVVEASPEQLTIKVEGQLRTYKIDRMPSPLVQSLANTKLARDPATKVLLGAYLLVDPDGDPARTRQLWGEAAREGMDVKDLIPELDQWATASPAPSPQSTQKTAPPTDEQELQRAEQAVRQTFKEEYDQATGFARKTQLATLLLDAARATSDDATLRFVLLREARDTAVAAGDVELASQAIDQIAGFHEVDALGMRTAALVEAAKNARGLNAQKAIAQSALESVGRAVEARRLDEAKQLADVALSAARKSNNRPLMQQAAAVVQRVEALQKQASGRATPHQSADQTHPPNRD